MVDAFGANAAIPWSRHSSWPHSSIMVAFIPDLPFNTGNCRFRPAHRHFHPVWPQSSGMVAIHYPAPYRLTFCMYIIIPVF